MVSLLDADTGEVYVPDALIVPYIADHVTAVFVALATVAVNCCVAPPRFIVGEDGEIEIVIGSGTTVTVAVELTTAMVCD
jgi:hypothetical protein